jgi:hypothetical protein
MIHKILVKDIDIYSSIYSTSMFAASDDALF